MTTYFEDKKTGQVFGFDDHQALEIAEKRADKNFTELSAPPAPSQEQIALSQQIEARREKELALKSIKVTVNGKEFDGHESARLNMTNALMVASFTGQTQTNWKLADNTVAQVTIADVQQALALSIQKVGEIIGAV